MMNQLKEFEELNESTNDSSELKNHLQPLVDAMFKLEEEREFLQTALNEKNRQIQEKEYQIRSLWSPYLTGVEKAEIELGDLKLNCKKILNVKAEDKDTALEWFAENGYKDVMRWDMHHARMAKIAKELHEKGEMVPGLNYSHFEKINVKPNRK